MWDRSMGKEEDGEGCLGEEGKGVGVGEVGI